MPIADKQKYLLELVKELNKKWPDNRTINIVCHGHSVPSGYLNTPDVRTFDAYPHLLHVKLKERHPWAVINVITTAIGGEHSEKGAKRFKNDVLCHKPDIITIDYSLGDRSIGLSKAKKSWSSMIEASLDLGIKVILLTPTFDYWPEGKNINLAAHAGQVRALASKYKVAFADSFKAFSTYEKLHGDAFDLLGYPNHPNRNGHEIVANELIKWFPYKT